MTLRRFARWCARNSLWRWLILSNLSEYLFNLSMTITPFWTGFAFGIHRPTWWVLGIPSVFLVLYLLSHAIRTAAARGQGFPALPELSIKQGSLVVIGCVTLLSLLDWSLSVPGRGGWTVPLSAAIPVLSLATAGIWIAYLKTGTRSLAYTGLATSLWGFAMAAATRLECGYAYVAPIGLALFFLKRWGSIGWQASHAPPDGPDERQPPETQRRTNR